MVLFLERNHDKTNCPPYPVLGALRPTLPLLLAATFYGGAFWICTGLPGGFSDRYNHGITLYIVGIGIENEGSSFSTLFDRAVRGSIFHAERTRLFFVVRVVHHGWPNGSVHVGNQRPFLDVEAKRRLTP